jgi:hypothetical protein
MMNKIWILAVALLLSVSYTKAQDTEAENNVNWNQVNKKSKEAPFKVTKGYYSIYRNADKLNHRPVKVAIDSSKSPDTYTKGYYSIGGKHKQLHKGGKSVIATTPKRPVSIKGYYSIKSAEVNIPEDNLMADAVDSTHIAPQAN